MVQIFWKDLTAEKQQEIIEAFGDNCNFDMIPIAELCLEEEEAEDEEDEDDLSGYGDNDDPDEE